MSHKIYPTIIIIAFIFLGFNKSSHKEINAIELSEAIANAQVNCVFAGNANSTHYHKPLIARIKNNRNKVITIHIPTGYQFEAEDEGYQNMLVTKSEIIKLNPNQTRNIEISAMCTEAGDSGPNANTKFKPGKKATGTLLKLAELIELNKFFNTEAQNAVWALTDNKDVDYITGYDTSCARTLQRFVCKETNRKMPPPPAKDDYERNYYSSNLKVTVGGMFEFSFPRPAHITIAMFNKNNVVVRELYQNPTQPPGQHKINYEFDASVYTDDVYYFKLIADGRVLINRKLEMDN